MQEPQNTAAETGTLATSGTSRKAVAAFNQRSINDTQVRLIECVKTRAEQLWDEIDTIQDYAVGQGPDAGRMFSVAKTKLEEVVMWATKGISRTTTENTN